MEENKCKTIEYDDGNWRWVYSGKNEATTWQITISQIFVVSSGILIKSLWNVRECQGIFLG